MNMHSIILLQSVFIAIVNRSSYKFNLIDFFSSSSIFKFWLDCFFSFFSIFLHYYFLAWNNTNWFCVVWCWHSPSITTISSLLNRFPISSVFFVFEIMIFFQTYLSGNPINFIFFTLISYSFIKFFRVL